MSLSRAAAPAPPAPVGAAPAPIEEVKLTGEVKLTRKPARDLSATFERRGNHSEGCSCPGSPFSPRRARPGPGPHSARSSCASWSRSCSTQAFRLIHLKSSHRIFNALRRRVEFKAHRLKVAFKAHVLQVELKAHRLEVICKAGRPKVEFKARR